MTEIEKKVLTIEEYEELLDTQLDTLEEKFTLAKDEYISAISVHGKYSTDKLKYRLEYFLEDDALIYEKFPKSKIGYTYGVEK